MNLRRAACRVHVKAQGRLSVEKRKRLSGLHNRSITENSGRTLEGNEAQESIGL
jgi:hypothetical protein